MYCSAQAWCRKVSPSTSSVCTFRTTIVLTASPINHEVHGLLGPRSGFSLAHAPASALSEPGVTARGSEHKCRRDEGPEYYWDDQCRSSNRTATNAKNLGARSPLLVIHATCGPSPGAEGSAGASEKSLAGGGSPLHQGCLASDHALGRSHYYMPTPCSTGSLLLACP